MTRNSEAFLRTIDTARIFARDDMGQEKFSTVSTGWQGFPAGFFPRFMIDFLFLFIFLFISIAVVLTVAVSLTVTVSLIGIECNANYATA